MNATLSKLLGLSAFCTFFLAASVKAEERFFRIVGPSNTLITAISTDGMVAWTNAAMGVCTVQTAQVLFDATNWVDYIQVTVTNEISQARLFDPAPPAGMVLIPSGTFTMGDPFTEGATSERPTHTVYVSAFYMDQYEVTKQLWDEVKAWAAANGYGFDNADSGKAANHPVHTVSWYDCVKWCNARSQKEGLAPAYYTDAAMTIPYKNGQVAPYVRWDRGYRLPTEAEWEKAARGGLSGKRFPWGDTISHHQANYNAGFSYSYDLSYPAGYHPNYQSGGYPYTSPVGSFTANGYELYDMAGNVWEWCWDWYSSSYYGSSPTNDPRGPASGSNRVPRGGSWNYFAWRGRAAYRYYDIPPYWNDLIGFRPVLPPGQ